MTEFLFPTSLVCIEGPDLAGKTTLYNDVHRHTGFKWNIQDRSFLSMVCYARQYGRDESHHRTGLMRELSNLNNRLVVVIPPEDAIVARLKKRGDDFQDEESIVHLRKIFVEEAAAIREFPNVLVVKKALSKPDLAEACVKFLEGTEQLRVEEVGQFIQKFVHAQKRQEATVDIRLNLSRKDRFSDIMIHPTEGRYYNEIMQKTSTTIMNEIEGKNPYDRPQGIDSRRFYYSSDSCIASVHFLIRDECLRVLSALRSTDVDRNASADLKFLCHLSTHIVRRFKWPCKFVELDLRFNCAHVRNDLSIEDEVSEI